MTSRFQDYRQNKKDELKAMRNDRDYYQRLAMSRAEQIARLEARIMEMQNDRESENSES